MMVAVTIMVFVIPVAFVHSPAFAIVVVMRVVPVSAFIRWVVPTAWNPLIAMSVRSPVAIDPYVAGAGGLAAALDTKRRRCAADVDGNLCYGWDGDG